MTEIRQDRNNHRVHNERNLSAIEKSLRDCGAGRSILIDNDNEIIAGNGCFQQAEKLGIPVKVIETDGTELIALKRTDLSYTDDKRAQLAVMDNSTSDLSEFDIDNLLDTFPYDTLVEFGVITPDEYKDEVDEAGTIVSGVIEGDAKEDSEKLKNFLEAKQAAWDRGSNLQEVNYWLCLVFQSYDQKVEFLSRLGNPETLYRLYADGQTIAQAMGIDITPNQERPQTVVVEKALADMTME